MECQQPIDRFNLDAVSLIDSRLASSILTNNDTF